MARGDARPLALLPPGAEVVEELAAPEEVLEGEDDEVLLPVLLLPVLEETVLLAVEVTVEFPDEVTEAEREVDPDADADDALEEAEAVAPRSWNSAP